MERGDRGCRSRCEDFDAAVSQVDRVATHAKSRGFLCGTGAKEYALHPTGNDETTRHFGSHDSHPITCRCPETLWPGQQWSLE